MEVVTSRDQIRALKSNHILGEFEFTESRVTFFGKNNLLIAPFSTDSAKAKLRRCNIVFQGDNSLVFLHYSQLDIILDLEMHQNNFCHVGMNNFFNDIMRMQCSEQRSIFIGDECLFSFGIWLRTADVHLLYDIESRKRINSSKSIFIGDRVWIGQNATIWKNAKIGSGAVIGANAFCSGKHYPSNTAWGGNPARLIRENVFFTGGISSKPFTDTETKRHEFCHKDDYIFSQDEGTVNFTEIERKIKNLSTVSKKAEWLVDFNVKKTKNRFFIGE